MKILVNGREAVLKANASFEYVSENPLFTEAEDYTMEIPFPMKDCPQNISILGPLHVKGVDISKVSFPCEIQTDAFVKSGILTITSVSDTEVKGQFLEGMSQQNFASSLPDVYLTDLDFSQWDGSDRSSESLENFHSSRWADLIVWDSEEELPIPMLEQYINTDSTEHRYIYLYHLVELVARLSGVTIDDSKLRAIPMYMNVVVVNTTNSIYGSTVDLERALPHWTLTQFLQELGNFFGCTPVVKNKSVSYIPNNRKDNPVSLEVLDDFSVELSNQEEQAYLGNKGFKLSDEADPLKLNMAEWILRYDYILYNKKECTSTEFYGWINEAAFGVESSVRMMLSSKTEIFYLSDLDLYAIVTGYNPYNTEGWDEESEGRPEFLFIEYEIMNQYGDFREGIELGLVPCQTIYKRTNKIDRYGNTAPIDSPNYVPYRMAVLPVIKDLEIEAINSEGYVQTEVLEALSSGEPEAVQYYEKLYIVLHTGENDELGNYLYTREYETKVKRVLYTEGVHGYIPKEERPIYTDNLVHHPYTLSPAEPTIQANAQLPKVDETKLYRYKFLAKTLPSPTSVFLIKGKRYACLKLTAQITVKGMSELVEGEFYEIID